MREKKIAKNRVKLAKLQTVHDCSRIARARYARARPRLAENREKVAKKHEKKQRKNVLHVLRFVCSRSEDRHKLASTQVSVGPTCLRSTAAAGDMAGSGEKAVQRNRGQCFRAAQRLLRTSHRRSSRWLGRA